MCWCELVCYQHGGLSDVTLCCQVEEELEDTVEDDEDAEEINEDDDTSEPPVPIDEQPTDDKAAETDPDKVNEY